MRIRTTILFCILYCVPGFSQKTIIDSLLIQLGQHLLEDTSRLDLLNELAYAYYTVDADKGLQTADRAILLAQKINDPRRLASAYSHKGLNNSVKGNDSIAVYFYNQALQLHTATGNKPGIGKVLHNIGLIYFGSSDYYKAISHHQQSFEIFKTLGDSLRMSYAMNSIGVNYMYLSEYPQALYYFLDVLRIAELKKNTALMSNCYSNMGIIYKKLSEYDKALEYHQKAYDIAKRDLNMEVMANSLGNIGVVYDAMANYDAALANYEQALNIGKETGNKRTVASNTTNIGTVYKNQEKYTQALQYMLQAKLLYEELGDKNNLASVLNQTGEIYAKAPGNTTDGLNKAIALQQQALALSKEIDAIERQSQSWESLSATYALKKDYQKSLDAYKNYILLRDSILNDEKAQEIGRNEMKFESEKKEAILNANHEAAIAKEKFQRKNILIISAIIAAVGILSFILFKRKKEADTQKNEAELKAAIIDTEMKALRAQMNPHFIFNSLNSIADYIRRNNIADADRYLSKFAKLMRIVLENSEEKEIALASDLEALGLYIQLEQLRVKNKFTYEINVDEALDKENTLIPPMILQPFVENSIWHGIAKKETAGKILVHIKKDGDMLHCSVEDDGPGMQSSVSPGQNNHKRSLGLKITNERINIINQTKQSNAAITISALHPGTKVEVRLPLTT